MNRALGNNLFDDPPFERLLFTLFEELVKSATFAPVNVPSPVFAQDEFR